MRKRFVNTRLWRTVTSRPITFTCGVESLDARMRICSANRRPEYNMNANTKWKIAALGLAAMAANAENYQLKASPETVVIGYYWSEAKPMLRIKSGDTVTIETVSGNPARIAELGVPKEQIPASLDAI